MVLLEDSSNTTNLIDENPVQFVSPETIPQIKFRALISGKGSCKENDGFTIGQGKTGHGVDSIENCLDLVSQYDSQEMVFEKDVLCQACNSHGGEGSGGTHFYVEKIVPPDLAGAGASCCQTMNPCKDLLVTTDRPRDGTASRDRECRGPTRCVTNEYEFKSPAFGLLKVGTNMITEEFFVQDRVCKTLNNCSGMMIQGPMQDTRGSSATGEPLATRNNICVPLRKCCGGQSDQREECKTVKYPEYITNGPWQDRLATNPFTGEKALHVATNNLCAEMNRCEGRMFTEQDKTLPMDGTSLSNRTCKDTRKCQIGEYEESEPQKDQASDAHFSTDRVCQPLNTCNRKLFALGSPVAGTIGTPKEGEGVSTSDNTCDSDLKPCGQGQYIEAYPSGPAERYGDWKNKEGYTWEGEGKTQAELDTLYGRGEHYNTKYVCKNLNVCTNQLYTEIDKAIPTDGTAYQRNRTCKNPRQCAPGMYIIEDAKKLNDSDPHFTYDTNCGWLEVCAGNQLIDESGSKRVENVNGTGYKNRVCKDLTECQSGEYMVSAPVQVTRTYPASTSEFINPNSGTYTMYTVDRVCARAILSCPDSTKWLRMADQDPATGVFAGPNVCVPLTECKEDEFESQAPTATSDRQCTKFKAPAEYFKGIQSHQPSCRNATMETHYLETPEMIGKVDGMYKRDKECIAATVCAKSGGSGDEYISKPLTCKDSDSSCTLTEPAQHDRECKPLRTHSGNADASLDCVNTDCVNPDGGTMKCGSQSFVDEPKTITVQGVEMYKEDRECIRWRECDRTTQYVLSKDRPTTTKDRVCSNLTRNSEGKLGCLESQKYDMPDRHPDSGYFNRDFNCDNKKEGGELCTGDDECIYGICFEGYHANDKSRCNCQSDHFCSNLESECPIQCIENHCGGGDNSIDTGMWVSQWPNRESSCGNLPSHKTKERDRTEGATFDGPWDCSVCTKNICPKICAKNQCYDFWNPNVSDANKCGKANHYKTQTGIEAGPYDCRGCSEYQSGSTALSGAKIASGYNVAYNTTDFVALSEEECKEFAARRKRIGAKSEIGIFNKSGWNGSSHCFDCSESEKVDGLCPASACDYPSNGDKSLSYDIAFAKRATFQTGMRTINNDQLPSGCLFSDYYLRFYYNKATSNVDDAKRHRLRIGKIPDE